MANLYKPIVKSSHWYTADGKPAHSQPKKDGDGDRATTIADAKKLSLLPSVTSILGIFDKPALMSWKEEQIATAAVKTPRAEKEETRNWVRRVKEAAYQQVSDAADLGKDIHAALEAAMKGEEWNTELKLYVTPVLAWFADKKITIVSTEKVLANTKHGYAGTSDVLFTWGKSGIGVIDYKTRKTKEGEKVTAYDGQALQLAAYAAAEWGEAALDPKRCLNANIFVSTTEPGRFDVVKHANPAADFEAFAHACALWRYLKGYDPRQTEAPAKAGGFCDDKQISATDSTRE